MRISTINSSKYNSNYPKIQYKSNLGHYYDNSDPDNYSFKSVRTNTFFLRNDLNWKLLADILDRKFKDKKRVNIYSVASSDGSEAYSLAATILNQNYKNKSKFFPIFASDKNKDVIDFTKNDVLNFNEEDLNKIKENGMEKYFSKAPNEVKLKIDSPHVDTESYIIDANLRKLVKFKCENLLNVIDDIEDDGNTVILCRNVTPYLSEEELSKLLVLAYHRLKPGSLIVIGDFDEKTDFGKRLNNAGFYEKYMLNVYEKRY